MNPKRQRFCEEFLIDRIGTQAAIRAGYAANSAHVTASRLLKDAKVRDCIDQLFAEQRERVEVSIDSLTELFIDDRKLAHDNKQAGAAVSATEKLAKLHGLLSERLRVDVKVTTEKMSDAEVEAELDGIVIESGRKGIVEKIARLEQLLVRFDRGEFDDTRVPKAPPVLVLPPSEFQSAPSEQ